MKNSSRKELCVDLVEDFLILAGRKKAETCWSNWSSTVQAGQRAGSAGNCTQQCWLAAAWARCCLGCCLCPGVTTVQCTGKAGSAVQVCRHGQQDKGCC